MKRLVLFVEGDGDKSAVYVLVKRLLNEFDLWGGLHLDEDPYRVGGANGLLKDERKKWLGLLRMAARERDLGGVLLVLDGDVRRVGDEQFCAARVARELAQASTRVGGGSLFSVATVFARQEFESWLIAGIESLAGRPLENGRAGVKAGTQPPEKDLELAPRDAKGWLSKAMESGYNEVRDQVELTKMVKLSLIRERRMRSFKRLEDALLTIVQAIRDDSHVVSPS